MTPLLPQGRAHKMRIPGKRWVFASQAVEGLKETCKEGCPDTHSTHRVLLAHLDPSSKTYHSTHLPPSPAPLSTFNLDLAVTYLSHLTDLEEMLQLLLLQQAGRQERSIHPYTAEPHSSNITATMKQPRTEGPACPGPAKSGRPGPVTPGPTSSHAYLGAGGPGCQSCVGSSTCNSRHLHPQLGCGWVTHRQMQV